MYTYFLDTLVMLELQTIFRCIPIYTSYTYDIVIHLKDRMPKRKPVIKSKKALRKIRVDAAMETPEFWEEGGPVFWNRVVRLPPEL